MSTRPTNLPSLRVEGSDDVSVVSALLRRHGVDTKKGTQHLWINSLGSVEELLDGMYDLIRTERDHPVGFVLDIDVKVLDRWRAVCDRLSPLGVGLPEACPADGFVATVPGFGHPFGVWLMPDCLTDGQVLEHLLPTLMSATDPLWEHAKSSTRHAKSLTDGANTAAGEKRWKCFGPKSEIKAQVHSWLAWQEEPGSPLGAAITGKVLGCDSAQALAFLRWIHRLYGFGPLAAI